MAASTVRVPRKGKAMQGERKSVQIGSVRHQVPQTFDEALAAGFEVEEWDSTITADGRRQTGTVLMKGEMFDLRVPFAAGYSYRKPEVVRSSVPPRKHVLEL